MPRTPAIMKPIGVTGLNHSGGVIYEEFLMELAGERGKRVIREMTENDPVVAGVIFAMRSIIMGVKWDVTPADQSSPALRAAELVKTAIHDMETPFEDVISDILSFLPYGFALEELTYKQRHGESRDPLKDSQHDDGMIGWADWSPRSQASISRWDIQKDRVVAAIQGNGGDEIRLPIAKLLHFKTGIHKGNPEGKSVLRGAYRPWYFKKHIETIEAIGVERDLAGLPVALIPAEYLNEEGRTAEQTAVYNAVVKGLKNVRNDEQGGALFPSDRDEHGNLLFEFTLMSSPGQRQFETGTVIERYDTRILMTMLADFIMLGHENVGSFALSNDKTNLFARAMGAVLSLIARPLNRQAVRRLMRVNNIPLELAPTLVPGDLETNNLPDLGTFVANLQKAGFNLVDLETENYLRQQAGLPRVTELNRPQPQDDPEQEGEAGSAPNDGDDEDNEE